MLREIQKMALMGLVIAAPVFWPAGCTSTGEMKNPFEKEKAYVPSAVPADFAIVVDEYHNTYYVQQHIQQVITSADMISRTKYTNFNSFTNAPDAPYYQETPLTPEQMQAMWNAVEQYDLLQNSHIWVNWLTDSDWYKRNVYTIQVRANNKTRSYQQVNGFPGMVQPLMTLVDAVRLPLTQDAKVSVVGSAATAPMTEPAPASSVPATTPATSP